MLDVYCENLHLKANLFWVEKKDMSVEQNLKSVYHQLWKFILSLQKRLSSPSFFRFMRISWLFNALYLFYYQFFFFLYFITENNQKHLLLIIAFIPPIEMHRILHHKKMFSIHLVVIYWKMHFKDIMVFNEHEHTIFSQSIN